MHINASIHSVLLIYNSTKERTLETAHKTQKILQRSNVTSTIEALSTDASLSQSSHWESCDAIIVFGGDGTFLSVARQTAEHPKPIMGINLGRFGFLTTSTCDELAESINALLTGNYRIQPRHLLKARVERTINNELKTVFTSYAINEALLTLSQPGRLLELWLSGHGGSALSYRGDGLIVSTATGSTGHSLSAGGPILEPHIAALVITPISPHSLFNRPLVFDGSNELTIGFHPDTSEPVLILDGHIEQRITSQDKVILQRTNQTIPTITLPDRNFIDVLRVKFNIGRLHEPNQSGNL